MKKVFLSTPTKETSGIKMDIKFINVIVSSAVNHIICISVSIAFVLIIGSDNALIALLKLVLSCCLLIFVLCSILYNARVIRCTYLYKYTSVRLKHSNMPKYNLFQKYIIRFICLCITQVSVVLLHIKFRT